MLFRSEAGPGERRADAVPATQPAVPVPPSAPPAAAMPQLARPAPVQAPAPAPAGPVLLSKDEFLNDPAIRMALEIFKGQIIEVRPPGA